MPAEHDPEGGVCPACGGQLVAWRTVLAAEPALRGTRFPLGRCRNCGSAVTLGAAAPELHESGAYRPGEPRGYRLVRPLLICLDRQRLALLSDLVRPPHGCSTRAPAGDGSSPRPARRDTTRQGSSRQRAVPTLPRRSERA